MAVQGLKFKWKRVVKLEAQCLWTVVVYTREAGRWHRGGGVQQRKMYPWSIAAHGE